LKNKSIKSLASSDVTSRPSASSGRPFTARPGSARPAPPKIVIKRENEEEMRLLELEEKNRLKSAKPVENLIVEKADDEDEEKEFVVDDSLPKVEDDFMSNEHLGLRRIEENQKGSLVKQLMETKKELEGNQSMLESDKSGEANFKLAARDIEKLRQNIQSLSKTVTPLGRVVDYLQEDIDSMTTELKVWKDEYKRNMIIVEKEKNTIDHDLEPLRAKLNILDNEIDEQVEKISTTKANIIRNEEKLQRMISIINNKSS
jgi:TRAF3-interacting protein 1